MGKYYDCETSLANVNTALTDYYGAYHITNNPTGVTIHNSSATDVIFSCTAISDKVIKIILSSSQSLAYYGDAYTSGTTITNQITWGGSSTSGSVAKIHLVLETNTFLFNVVTSTQNSKVYIVTKLTNNAYAVLGMVGASSTLYNKNHFCYLTASQTRFNLGAMSGNYKTSTGKLMKQVLILYDVVNDAYMSGENFVTIPDVYTCSRRLGNTSILKGVDFFITTSGLYTDSETIESFNSLLMDEVDE